MENYDFFPWSTTFVITKKWKKLIFLKIKFFFVSNMIFQKTNPLRELIFILGWSWHLSASFFTTVTDLVLFAIIFNNIKLVVNRKVSCDFQDARNFFAIGIFCIDMRCKMLLKHPKSFWWKQISNRPYTFWNINV